MIQQNKKVNLKRLYSEIDCNLLEQGSDLVSRVRKQIQYYLSDANLLYDFFLKRKLVQYKNQLPIQLFLSFNKINKMLAQSDDMKKLQYIRLAVNQSKLLTLKKYKKIKRKVPFQQKSIQHTIAQRTIYVQGFGQKICEQKIVKIFGRVGHIVRVYLPKFQSGYNKGFCFITYEKKQQAEEAKKQLNSLIIMQLFDQKEGIRSLKILSRNEWQKYKTKLKQIKKFLSTL